MLHTVWLKPLRIKAPLLWSQLHPTTWHCHHVTHVPLWGQAALEAEAVLEALGPHAEDDRELAAKARAAADRAVSAFNDAKGYIRHALNTSAGALHHCIKG
jgi:hypothetical protein